MNQTPEGAKWTTMVMNTIIHFSDVIATAAPQQQCLICRCEVVESKNQ